jgi:hypothetical protein
MNRRVGPEITADEWAEQSPAYVTANLADMIELLWSKNTRTGVGGRCFVGRRFAPLPSRSAADMDVNARAAVSVGFPGRKALAIDQ